MPPSCICSGIGGIQSAIVTAYARASAGKPSSCQKASTDSPSAATIVAHATNPEVRRENARMPTRPLRAAPTPGNRGMSQMYFILASTIGD